MKGLTIRDRIGLIFLKLGALITSSTKITFKVGDNTYTSIMYVPRHLRKATKTGTAEYWAEKQKRVNESDEKFVVLDTFESKLP